MSGVVISYQTLHSGII